MRKIGVIFCLCLLFCNCDSRSPLIKDEKTLRSLIDKALNENDEFAYSEVRAHYFSEERLQDFCYYAIKMANKYDYPDAYYDCLLYTSVKIEQSWKDQLKDEFEKDYFEKLTDFVRVEYKTKQIFPPARLIFNAFEHTPFDKMCIRDRLSVHQQNKLNSLQA